MRYFDSGVLVKLYRHEPNSDVAAAHAQATGRSIVLTPLHLIEIRTALRLMVARGEISSRDCQGAIDALDEDRVNRVYIEPAIRWDRVFVRTEQLSAAHTSTTHC